MLVCRLIYSLDKESILDKVIDFYSLFFNNVNRKTTQVEERLTKQGEWYFQHLAKHELRLQRKFSTIGDPGTQQLFRGCQKQCKQSASKIKGKAGKLNQAIQSEYFPRIDTLRISLSFSQQNDLLPDNAKNSQPEVQGPWASVNRTKLIVDIKFSKMIKKAVLGLVQIVLFIGYSYSQGNNALNTDFTDKILTPSPAVASMGTFGGVDARKSTGGVSKSIPLFTVESGMIKYAPMLEYYSTGVKVNDWGGRLGISWSDNFSGTIQRTVKGLPDERAVSRVNNLSPAGISEYTQENLTRIKQMVTALSINSGTDGEYDVFNITVPGIAATFIIKEGQAVLLNHEKAVRIEVFGINPYEFCVTDEEGIKYFFGQNGASETVVYDADNSCDLGYCTGLPVPTAWFLTKITSPLNDRVDFIYGSLTSKYIYDYSESYLLKNGQESSDQGRACDEFEHYYKFENNYCIRRKIVNTKYLTRVSSDNFYVSLDYLDREDIQQEKLVQSISLSSNNQTIKQCLFSYSKLIANSTIESKINFNLENVDEGTRLKTRYFLTSLQVVDNTPFVYEFSYLNADLLPHRFCFGQDADGYYNGEQGDGFISRYHTNIYKEYFPSLKTLPNPIQTTNRDPGPMGSCGLLSEIKYPTGGNDLIKYEPNVYTYVKEVLTPALYTETLRNYSTSHLGEAASQVISVSFEQKATLMLECSYDDVNWPSDDDGEMYYIDYYVHNLTDGLIIPIEGMDMVSQLKYIKIGKTDTIRSVVLEPDKEYEVICDIHGRKTFANLSISYFSQRSYEKTNELWTGTRVKEVISRNEAGEELLHKYFDYRAFEKNEGNLLFKDESSLEVAKDDFMFLQYSYVKVLNDRCSYPLSQDYFTRFYNLLSNPGGDRYMYGNESYAYSCITEFYGIDKLSFKASYYATVPNSPGDELLGMGAATLGLPLSNSAWKHGLELFTYLGKVSNTQFKILKVQEYQYENSSESVHHNYIPKEIFNLDRVYGVNEPGFEYNFYAYSLKYYSLYSQWYRLSSIKESDYFESPAGLSILDNETIFTYDASDKLLKEKRYTTSKGDVVKIEYKRPAQMVAEGSDPAGIYQQMLTLGMSGPVVESIKSIGDRQIEKEHTEYYKSTHDLFLPKFVSFKVGNNDEQLRYEFHLHDDRGNPLWLTKSGMDYSYVWSYSKKYAIAEVKNGVYTDIEALYGAQNLNTLSNSTIPTDDQIKNLSELLRNNLTGSQVTAYAFQPLVGISRIIDTRGRTVSYQYDIQQRLMSVFDHDRNIIKHFDYVYKGESREPEQQELSVFNSTNETFSITFVSMDDASEIPCVANTGEHPVSLTIPGSYKIKIPYNSNILAGTVKVFLDCQPIPAEEWIENGSEIVLDDYYISQNECTQKLKFAY